MSARDVLGVLRARDDAAGRKMPLMTELVVAVRRLADEILFLHRGRLIAHAPAGDILNDPKPEEVRAFIDSDLYW